MKIAIIGYGVEGQSAFKYWSKKNANITVHDQNPDIELPNGVQAVLGDKAYSDLDKYEYDFLVRSPGSRLGKNLTTPVTSATNEFFEQCPAKIIGVTGTKGKGTTSSLITEFLKTAGYGTHLVGNIGLPCLDVLSDVKPDDWVVFEMSSFQLFDMKQSPHVAVHLMLEPDHLDWHKDMNEYIQAKANIFRFQKPKDIAVYYAGSKIVQASAELSSAITKIPYARDMDTSNGVRVHEGKICFQQKPIAEVTDVRLVGEHMLDNVCAAIAATILILSKPGSLGTVKPGIYKSTLREFTGLSHRVQLITQIGGVKYIDDSYSSTPSAAVAGLKAFTEPKVVILGGYDKNAEFTDLATTVRDNNVTHAVVIGATAPKIIAALDNIGFKNYSTGQTTMDAIVAESARLAKPGQVVLLSPGCASFDMFKNFSDRGDQFIASVKALAK